MSALYNNVSFSISRLITHHYSTSFSLATRMFRPEVRDAIYSVYGFVRLADEIVDTFHDHDKKILLQKFENDYYDAFNSGISLNPVLHAFQFVVKKYNITDDLVQAFLNSMKSDITERNYCENSGINEYIYGSAEVVGLMCLRIFSGGNDKIYEDLRIPAMKLGSAFQKVNFLRDLKNDVEHLGRCYLCVKDLKSFDENIKAEIVADIQNDFDQAYKGIRMLPDNIKMQVLTAFFQYQKLLRYISDTPAEEIIHKRIRVNNFMKILLFLKAYIICKLRII